MNGRRELRTSFHYDHVFGTVLNRFLAQAAAGSPLTIYGSGGQTRGFLNLKDTIQCVALAADNPASEGEFRVFNQCTEQFSVNQLAKRVVETAARAGVEAVATPVSNPRVELEDHYYNAQHTALIELGLHPTLLADTVLDEMFDTVHKQSSQINSGLLPPSIKWAANKGD